MSIHDDVLRYLQEGGVLTRPKAVAVFDCYELSARIVELQAQGHDIKKTKATVGGKVFTAYRFKKGYDPIKDGLTKATTELN